MYYIARRKRFRDEIDNRGFLTRVLDKIKSALLKVKDIADRFLGSNVGRAIRKVLQIVNLCFSTYNKLELVGDLILGRDLISILIRSATVNSSFSYAAKRYAGIEPFDNEEQKQRAIHAYKLILRMCLAYFMTLIFEYGEKKYG